MNRASKQAPKREAPAKIYLCAQIGSGPESRKKADAATMAALLYLEQGLTSRKFAVQIGPADGETCNRCQPQAALQLDTQIGGIGCEVYHPVTNNWQRYGQSIRLAKLLEEQARRYRLLCRREIMAGAQLPWLQAVAAPAAVCICNLPQEGGIYDHLPLIRAQMQGYAQAVAVWWEQEKTQLEQAKQEQGVEIGKIF